MAAAVLNGTEPSPNDLTNEDVFADDISSLGPHDPSQNRHSHRYSSHIDPSFFTLGPESSPSQVKRTLEAHLSETDRRLQDTQNLGNALLQQQSELTDRLREVEEQKDEAEISPGLRKRLVELEKEHTDVGKEIARALLGPKSRNVSGEEKQASDGPATFSSQASSSPTKVIAPSRKQRNQPVGRVGDIQFAADISTSLLAQVRQMQAMLVERDEAIKSLNGEKANLELDAQGFSSRLKALDESEQRYKDESYNLETQLHELKIASQETSEKEKRLNAALAVALTEKSRAQNDLDEVKLAHEQLTSDHTAAKKAHDLEVHGMQKDLDLGDNERDLLQSKIDELAAQNHELARGLAGRSRGRSSDENEGIEQGAGGADKEPTTPEHSPPPSPTKQTPRHGGLESETLKSSLHHAHRMIQNLKGTIHREKTEKVELRRLLESTRDELEARRADGSLGSGSKRQKTKLDISKKAIRGDMLGGSRNARTDVELYDEDWEDHASTTPVQGSSRNPTIPGAFETPRGTDVSDAYHTATEAEGPFDTADEKQGTESDDFQTGAESLAGDSTDELTEREDNPGPKPRTSLAFKSAGDRTSFLSTASTSAGEEEDDLRTPIQATSQKFRLKNGRHSLNRQSRAQRESTPETPYSKAIDSPATINSDRSPPAAEQSLFAELGGMDDAYNTPGRSSIASQRSTPASAMSARRSVRDVTPTQLVKAASVNAGTMTEPWMPEPPASTDHTLRDSAGSALLGAAAGYSIRDSHVSSSDFPLPPTAPASTSPEVADRSTQYTPSKASQESPMRGLPSFITPPKTVWDEAQDGDRSAGSHDKSKLPLAYSGVLAQDTAPLTPRIVELPVSHALPVMAYSTIATQEITPVTPTYAESMVQSKSQQSAKRPKTAEKAAGGIVAGGMLASAAAALGFSRSKDSRTPVIAEDETSEDLPNEPDNKTLPLQDVSGNAGPRGSTISRASEDHDELKNAARIPNKDQSCQTLISSKEIDDVLQAKQLASITTAAGPASREQITAPASPEPRTPSKPRDLTAVAEAAPLVGAAAASKRPSSAHSQRVSSAAHHPPLPPDHKTAIARASGVPPQPSPGREPSNSSHIATMMGPPIAPASAYRLPRTPAESIRSPTRDGTTPRPHQRHSTRDRTMASPGGASRRSSVSSFASELDERFNIRAAENTGATGLEPSSSTDPRMIAAITQTMIGEFLWKYTRKAGSTDMSTTRHRRYFWVHPYTKTLYWSNSDPQSAGRTELKAKSVLIQSVRVVTDDNPMPPGLHRKSLEIITAGRRVKVTASTSQRHEVWFNALSYLLLRSDIGAPGQHMGPYAADPTAGITDADVDEFRVGGYHGPDRDGRSRSLLRPQTASRASVSSYNSRGTSANRSVVRMSSATRTSTINPAAATAASRASTVVRHSTQGHVASEDPNRTVRGSHASNASTNRFSRMFGSATGTARRSTANTNSAHLHADDNDDAIYDASVVSDSGRPDEEEEMRREMLRQEREGLGKYGGGHRHTHGDGLENVRSCCDGRSLPFPSPPFPSFPFPSFPFPSLHSIPFYLPVNHRRSIQY